MGTPNFSENGSKLNDNERDQEQYDDRRQEQQPQHEQTEARSTTSSRPPSPPSPLVTATTPSGNVRFRTWRKRTSVLSNMLSQRRHSGNIPTLNDFATGYGTGYDSEFRDDYLATSAGNGVRAWYENFNTIDWIHDGIKDSVRLSKIRFVPGLRGWMINFWDRSQGWIIVTITGLLVACVAGFIVKSEMWLFDIKDGYCVPDWTKPKRHCCPESASSPSIDHHNNKSKKLGGFISQWGPVRSQQEICSDWTSWSQVAGIDQYHYVFNSFVYIAFSLLFACIASLMTVHLSSSESVYSTKDETAPAPVRSAAPLHISPSINSAQGLASKSSTKSSYGTIPNGKDNNTAKNNNNSDGTSSKYLHPDDINNNDNDDPKLPTTETTNLIRSPSFVQQEQRKRKVMYFAAGSGIPEIKTILSGFVIRGYLGTWTLITKAVGLFLSVASGLSLGKEGPFVHIGSCIGNITSRFFPKFDTNEAKRREIISAACASGVAVAFGAPVGGVLFSLEEVSYFFPPKVMWRSFFCAMIAAVTLKYIDPFGKGKIVLFEVSYDRETAFIELFGFVLLGLFGGVYGAFFSKWNIWWARNIRGKTFLKTYPVIEVLLVTLLTVLISLTNRFLKSGGTELVYEMFAECDNNSDGLGLCIKSANKAPALMGAIAFALVAKGLLTVITFGIKVPAGIFIPTLAVGACAGRIAGLLIEYAYAQNPESAIFQGCRSNDEFGQACVLPGIWAMVGAAAALAGVTRTTVSLAVIMFELTGTLEYVVPVMLSVLVAKTSADAIEHRGIYDLVIELNELPYLDAKREYIHTGSPGEILDADAPVIDLQDRNTVSSLQEKVIYLETQSYAHGFPIVSTDNSGATRLQAYIAARDLAGRLAELKEDESITGDSLCSFTKTKWDAMSSSGSSSVVPGTIIEFSHLTDNAPITVSINSPMELLHEMFVRLGVRYLVVIDDKGLYSGVIEKNRWLGYLDWTQEKAKDIYRISRKNNSQEP